MNNIPIDNSKANLVLLSYEDHVKVHKLAYLCTTGKMKRNMAYAYHRLTKGQIVANGCFNGENNPFYGKHHSDDARRNISEAKKGKKRTPFTEEHRRKIAESMKGRISPMKGKHLSNETLIKMSESHKGKVPWNKGQSLTEETKQKLSVANKGTHWYNDGKVNMRAYTCPEGFVKGKLNHGE